MSASVWRGALVLTMASIAVKIMSAAYRIPFQNIVGDLGFYVYQQIYPFFAVAVFFATYGFPAAISRLVASRIADGDREGAAGVVVHSFYIMIVFTTGVFALLYFGAHWISGQMGDVRLVVPLQTVAFSFLFIPLIAGIRGFFQGYGWMHPTAASQIFEQFTRAGLIIGLTVYVTMQSLGSYAAGTAAGAGSTAGMAAASGILLFFAFKHRHLLMYRPKRIGFGVLLKTLSYEGIAFSASSLALVLFLLVDTFTVVPLLDGYLPAARVHMGIYDRGYPIVQLATAAALSFSLAFVPAMAGAQAKGDDDFIHEKSKLAAKLCAAFGVAAAAGFALLAGPIDIMLFRDDSGVAALAWFGVTMLFSMTAMTAAGLLQALGKAGSALRSTGIGLIAKVALNFCLIPLFGIVGAATATVVSFALIAVLNGWHLHRRTGAFAFLPAAGRKLLAAVLLMAVTVIVWRMGCTALLPGQGERWSAAIVALGGVIFGAGAYLAGLVRFGFFSKTELASLSSKEKRQVSA